MNDFINQVSQHARQISGETMKQLRQMQPSPMGTTKRSPQQEAALWKKMKALPSQEFNALGDQIAAKVGHANDEEQPCQWCGFLMAHAGS